MMGREVSKIRTRNFSSPDRGPKKTLPHHHSPGVLGPWTTQGLSSLWGGGRRMLLLKRVP